MLITLLSITLRVPLNSLTHIGSPCLLSPTSHRQLNTHVAATHRRLVRAHQTPQQTSVSVSPRETTEITEGIAGGSLHLNVNFSVDKRPQQVD